MSPSTLVTRLRENKVKVWVEGEKLRYRTVSGKLPADLRSEISTNKLALIEYLNEINKNNENSYHRADYAIPTVSRIEKLPMSYAEERLWFIHQLNSEAPVFSVSASVPTGRSVEPRCFESKFE